MKIRYVVSHIDRDGLRVMSFGCNPINTYTNLIRARTVLKGVNENNHPDTLSQVFGKQALGTFAVSKIECWDNLQPKGIFIKKALNPDQTCMTEEFKKKYNFKTEE